MCLDHCFSPPTPQAALLDARAVSLLSRFLHKLVSASLTAAGAAAMDPAEVPVVAGQASGGGAGGRDRKDMDVHK
jgi:hypothetical protein